MNRLGKISLSVLGTLIITGTTAFATTGTVNTNGVRVRKEASTDGEILTNLNNGESIEVLEESGDWYKVKYENKEGYMYKTYVTVSESVKTATEPTVIENATTSEPSSAEKTTESPEKIEEQDPNIQTITTGIQTEFPKQVKIKSEIKIYLLPAITSKVKKVEAAQSTITLNKELNNWQYITTSDNVSGWIRKNATSNAVAETKPEGEATQTAQTTVKAYVNASSANIRKEPSTSAEVLKTAVNNTEIEIIAEEGDWCKIKYQETTGYIYKSLVSETPVTTSRSSEARTIEESKKTDEAVSTQATELKTGYVNVGVANVRESATTSAKILTTLNSKTQVEIMGEKEDFYEINLNGKVGYIAKRLVSDKLDNIVSASVPEAKTNTETVTTSNGSSEGERIVNFAKQYLGYSYVYGGTTPEGGFDCSGFMYYVFNSCGYSLSRSCSSQAKSGTAVEKSDLQLGDIIFFDNTSDGSIGHMGIYIGDGKFIHAANSKRGVVTDTINSGYYYTYYYSARRIAN